MRLRWPRSAGHLVHRDDEGTPAALRRRLSSAAATGGRGATNVAAQLPGAMHATWSGASGTTGALRRLPDSTLIAVATTSLGLALGFYLARVPRLIVLAGIVPVIFTSAAIVLRPSASAGRAEREHEADPT